MPSLDISPDCTCLKRPGQDGHSQYDLYIQALEEERPAARTKEFDLEGFFSEAKRRASKAYLTLEDFRAAKDLCSIDRILRSCKYPEDDESPSGRQFIPLLLLRRCKLMLDSSADKKDNARLNEFLLRDLCLVEDKWLEFLPESEHHSLHRMKMQCQMRLQQFADAKASHGKTLEALEDVGEQQGVEEIRAKLAAGLSLIHAKRSSNGTVSSKRSMPSVRSAFNIDGALPPGVFMQIKYSQECENGRSFVQVQGVGLVAEKAFSPGDALLLERPLFLVAKPGAYGECSAIEVCHMCLQDTLKLSFPCSGCSLVMFCSMECRDLALQDFHKYECGLGVAFMNQSITFTRVSAILRTVFSLGKEIWMATPLYRNTKESVEEEDDTSEDETQQGKAAAVKGKKVGKGKCQTTKQGRNGKEERETGSSPQDAAWARKSKRALERYARKLTVTTKAHLVRDRSAGSERYYRLVDLAVSHSWILIKQSGMLEPITPEVETNSLKVLHQLALDHQRGLMELRRSGPTGFTRVKKFVPVVQTVGHGVFSVLSQLTHSCLPNARYVDVDGETAVVTIRAIAKGEEVTVPHFMEIQANHGARSRIFWAIRRSRCYCEACEGGWERDVYTRRELEKRKGVKKALAQLSVMPRGGYEVGAFLEHQVRQSMLWRKSMTKETYAVWSNINADGFMLGFAAKYCSQ